MPSLALTKLSVRKVERQRGATAGNVYILSGKNGIEKTASCTRNKGGKPTMIVTITWGREFWRNYTTFLAMNWSIITNTAYCNETLEMAKLELSRIAKRDAGRNGHGVRRHFAWNKSEYDSHFQHERYAPLPHSW